MSHAKHRPLLWTDKWFFLAAVVSVALVVGAEVYFLRNRLGGKAPEFTHMHCTVCNEETGYDKRLAGKACTYCENKGATFEPTIGSIWEGGSSSASRKGPIFAFGLVFAVVAQAFAYFCYLRTRQLREAYSASMQQLTACRCPTCGRKFRYPVAQAGRTGKCPRCKKLLTLPEVAVES